MAELEAVIEQKLIDSCLRGHNGFTGMFKNRGRSLE